MMQRLDFKWATLSAFLMTICLIGCGGSSEPEVMTDQDELSEWVANNPAPEEIPLEDEF